MGNSNGKPVVFTDEGQLPQLSHSLTLSPLHKTKPHLPPADARAPKLACMLTPPFSIVNLNHFRLLRVVGKGAFGKVRIVERKDTGLTFALKYIRKDEGQHMSRGTYRRPTIKAYTGDSGTIGERTEHHQRAENAGTPQSCLPLQLAVQLSGH